MEVFMTIDIDKKYLFTSLYVMELPSIRQVAKLQMYKYKQVLMYILCACNNGIISLQHLPLMVTVLALFLALLKLVSFTHSLLAFNGIVVSWLYLRFYEKQDSGQRGDMSESFSFATFFPELMQ